MGAPWSKGSSRVCLDPMAAPQLRLCSVSHRFEDQNMLMGAWLTESHIAKFNMN